jgi:hypothetical protein
VIRKSSTYRIVLRLTQYALVVLGGLWVDTALTNGIPDTRGDSYHTLESLNQVSQNGLLGEDGHEPVFLDPNLIDPNMISVILTPAGGHYELEGGLVIDVPVGAVSEETSFLIRLLDANEVQPHLDSSMTEKRFMGGFEVFSNGIAFDLPMSIRVPVDPLRDANSLPFLFDLDKEYSTVIPDLPDEIDTPVYGAYSLQAASSVRRSQRSDFRLAGIASAEGLMYDPRDALANVLLQVLVLPPVLENAVILEVYNLMGHQDCLHNPCRCLRQRKITERSADLISSTGCSNVKLEGHVTYPDCPGQPTESWTFQEQSIYIRTKFIPDRRSISCQESLRLDTSIIDIKDNIQKGYKVKVTSSRPDLLEVTTLLDDLHLLERVGDKMGVAHVVIDAGCDLIKRIPIQVGGEIPNVTGLWSASGTETWWDCQEPEDNATYPISISIEFDSQVESTFAGSFSFFQEYEDYTESYQENYFGEITQDCEITERYAYKVTGYTTYTHKYHYPSDGDHPYTHITEGTDTFSGALEKGVMRLTTLGADTSGDTCNSHGTIILTR